MSNAEHAKEDAYRTVPLDRMVGGALLIPPCACVSSTRNTYTISVERAPNTSHSNCSCLSVTTSGIETPNVKLRGDTLARRPA